MPISDLTRQFQGTKESFTQQNGGSQSVVYTVPWADRASATGLLGAASSDYSHLTCGQVDIEPLGDAMSDTGGPRTAKVTASFSFSPPSAPTGAFSDWREQWQGGGEAITLPGPGFKWSSDDKKLGKGDVQAVKLFPTATIVVTGTPNIYVVSDIAAGKTYALGVMGKINAAATSIRGFSYAAKKLLCTEVGFDEGRSPTGAVCYTVTFKFAYRHGATWNEFWRNDKAGGPGWDTLVDDSGNSPYETALFSDLDCQYWHA